MKRCTKCKVTKPLSGFHRNRGRKDGVQVWCKKCAIAARVDYYKRNREKENKRNKEWAKSRRAQLTEYLSFHPCVDCGEKDPVVLEFDHVRGEKEAAVTDMVRSASWKRTITEIAKCEIRCANCHRRRHHKLRA